MEICDLLGIDVPIIQGAMAYVSRPSLVAAVSEAGGLGVLSTSGLSAADLRQELSQCRELTAKPFGVNLMLQAPNIEELLQVLFEEKVPVVTTGAGTPKAFLKDLQAQGTKVIPVIATLKHAQKMADLGADAIVAEGREAGGHIGPSTGLPLWQAVQRTVAIPMVAAGGIGSGQAIVAAEALGAAGVQIGTRFLAAWEAHLPKSYTDLLCAADDQSTVVTGESWGQPVRSLATDFLEEIRAAEFQGTDPKVIGERLKASYQAALGTGDWTKSSPMAGEVASLITEVKPAREIMAELQEEAQATRSLLQARWS